MYMYINAPQTECALKMVVSTPDSAIAGFLLEGGVQTKPTMTILLNAIHLVLWDRKASES